MEKEIIKANWEQLRVEHCPDFNCNGMLLQSIYYHEQKCSKCGKYFIQICEWKETTFKEDGDC